MPVIGSSSVGVGPVIIGPKGNTGNTGSIGPMGATTGSTGPTGPTGTTGTYVVSSESDVESLYITLSDGREIKINGLVGPTGFIGNAHGKTLGSGVDVFKEVTNGTTFWFKGISADGSLSVVESDNTIIIKSLSSYFDGVISGASDGRYAYLQQRNQVSATGLTFDDGTMIFGPGYTGNQFSLDLEDKIIKISPIEREEVVGVYGQLCDENPSSCVGRLPGDGIQLAVTAGSVLDIQCPIGISGFTGDFRNNELFNFTIILRNNDIWKFPSNVKIDERFFSCGTDIINIMSDDAGENWNASITVRGYGTKECTSVVGLGSCCYRDEGGVLGCKDFTTQEECEEYNDSYWNPLSSCRDSCGIDAEGICCSAGGNWGVFSGDGVCIDQIKPLECNYFFGNFYETFNYIERDPLNLDFRMVPLDEPIPISNCGGYLPCSAFELYNDDPRCIDGAGNLLATNIPNDICASSCDCFACCKNGSCIGDSSGNGVGSLSPAVCRYVYGGTPIDISNDPENSCANCGNVECCGAGLYYGACCYPERTDAETGEVTLAHCDYTDHVTCSVGRVDDSTRMGGGIFMGPETECGIGYGDSGICCFLETTYGACCIDGSCQTETAQECSNAGGLFWGTGVSCQTVSCDTAQELGACCVSGFCMMKTQPGCSDAEGEWRGMGTSCGAHQICTDSPVGACCIEKTPGWNCVNEHEDFCVDLGGDWYGSDSDCDSITCGNPPEMGACCFTDGTCIDDKTQSDCTKSGGTWRGDGTDCATVDCGDPLGACCDPITGSCYNNKTNAECTADGGVWKGQGTICDDVTCDQPTGNGACCVPNGGCVDMNSIACDDIKGYWHGLGTLCIETNCGDPDPVGACCLTDGSCQNDTTNGQCCLDLCEYQGEWQGPATNCNDVTCSVVVTGACCVGTSCYNYDEDFCIQSGGQYWGDETNCNDANVDCGTEPPIVGACCYTDADGVSQCFNGQTEPECVDYCNSNPDSVCEWQGSQTDCSTAQCDETPGACCTLSCTQAMGGWIAVSLCHQASETACNALGTDDSCNVELHPTLPCHELLPCDFAAHWNGPGTDCTELQESGEMICPHGWLGACCLPTGSSYGDGECANVAGSHICTQLCSDGVCPDEDDYFPYVMCNYPNSHPNNPEWQNCEGGGGGDPFGACCIDDICSQLTLEDCAGFNGIFHGYGVECGATTCALLGACCNNGVCADTLEEDCQLPNIWLPDKLCSWTNEWEQGPCHISACCIAGECTDTIMDDCEGSWQHSGDCSSFSCTTDPEGACCIPGDPSPTCESLTEGDCGTAGGEWLGQIECIDPIGGTVCDPIRACCTTGTGTAENCENVTESECEEGQWFADQICVDLPDGGCDTEVLGPCCVVGGSGQVECREGQTYTECYNLEGTWYHPSTYPNCDSIDIGPCSYNLEEPWACCYPETSGQGTICDDMTADACVALGGYTYVGQSCEDEGFFCTETGACCTSCVGLECDCVDGYTLLDCNTANGGWFGTGSVCADVSCTDVAACCYIDGNYDTVCENIRPADCTALGGTFHSDGDCKNVDFECDAVGSGGACCVWWEDDFSSPGQAVFGCYDHTSGLAQVNQAECEAGVQNSWWHNDGAGNNAGILSSVWHDGKTCNQLREVPPGLCNTSNCCPKPGLCCLGGADDCRRAYHSRLDICPDGSDWHDWSATKPPGAGWQDYTCDDCQLGACGHAWNFVCGNGEPGSHLMDCERMTEEECEDQDGHSGGQWFGRGTLIADQSPVNSSGVPEPMGACCVYHNPPVVADTHICDHRTERMCNCFNGTVNDDGRTIETVWLGPHVHCSPRDGALVNDDPFNSCPAGVNLGSCCTLWTNRKTGEWGVECLQNVSRSQCSSDVCPEHGEMDCSDPNVSCECIWNLIPCENSECSEDLFSLGSCCTGADTCIPRIPQDVCEDVHVGMWSNQLECREYDSGFDNTCYFDCDNGIDCSCLNEGLGGFNPAVCCNKGEGAEVGRCVLWEEDDCCCELEPVDPNNPDCGRPEVSCVYCCSQGSSQDIEETPGHAANRCTALAPYGALPDDHDPDGLAEDWIYDDVIYCPPTIECWNNHGSACHEDCCENGICTYQTNFPGACHDDPGGGNGGGGDPWDCPGGEPSATVSCCYVDYHNWKSYCGEQRCCGGCTTDDNTSPLALYGNCLPSYKKDYIWTCSGVSCGTTQDDPFYSCPAQNNHYVQSPDINKLYHSCCGSDTLGDCDTYAGAPDSFPGPEFQEWLGQCDGDGLYWISHHGLGNCELGWAPSEPSAGDFCENYEEYATIPYTNLHDTHPTGACVIPPAIDCVGAECEFTCRRATRWHCNDHTNDRNGTDSYGYEHKDGYLNGTWFGNKTCGEIDLAGIGACCDFEKGCIHTHREDCLAWETYPGPGNPDDPDAEPTNPAPNIRDGGYNKWWGPTDGPDGGALSCGHPSVSTECIKGACCQEHYNPDQSSLVKPLSRLCAVWTEDACVNLESYSWTHSGWYDGDWEEGMLWWGIWRGEDTVCGSDTCSCEGAHPIDEPCSSYEDCGEFECCINGNCSECVPWFGSCVHSTDCHGHDGAHGDGTVSFCCIQGTCERCSGEYEQCYDQDDCESGLCCDYGMCRTCGACCSEDDISGNVVCQDNVGELSCGDRPGGLWYEGIGCDDEPCGGTPLSGGDLTFVQLPDGTCIWMSCNSTNCPYPECQLS